MEINGEHRFEAPRSLVWQLLLDPETLRRTLPGCQRLEETAPDAYDVTMRIGIAAIRGSYDGTVTVEERQPEDSFRLGVSGSGKPGSVQGQATLHLHEDGGGTLVRYEGDVRAQGAIARMGSRLLSGTAKLLIGQFFKAMDNEVQQRVA